MASWMVHLRVADKLLAHFPSLMPTEFVVGNMAPDSGLPNEDGTAYTPNKDESHFRTCGEDGHRHPDPSLFASLYLSPEQLADYTTKERSFYLGYYAHLLTDVAWTSDIVIPTVERFHEEYTSAPVGFINGPLKRDWYDLDYLYLKEHPNFQAWEIYKAAEGFDNTYIDRFARHAFADRREFIVWFYSQEKDNLEREYPYLTKERAEEFVEETAAGIAKELKLLMIDRSFGMKESLIDYPTRIGAYIIPMQNEQVAVVKTPRGYMFIGGGIETNETDEECILRECVEETGYHAVITDYIGCAESYGYFTNAGNLHLVQRYYIGTLDQYVSLPIEDDHALVWVPYDELKNTMLLDMQNWALTQCHDKMR